MHLLCFSNQIRTGIIQNFTGRGQGYRAGTADKQRNTQLSFQVCNLLAQGTSANGLQTTRDDGTKFYVSYANNVFSHTKTAGQNRIYVYKEEALPAIHEYVALTGSTVFNLATGSYADQDAVLAMIRENISVQVAEDDVGTNAKATEDYAITGTVDPAAADTYNLKVAYHGVELGTITVNVKDKTITAVAVDPMTGSVARNAKADDETGSTLTVTYEDGSAQRIPVTVGMLSGEGLNLKASGTYA